MLIFAVGFHLQFSLPLPQGGRDAVTKNPILREDQLPQKFLYPKTKKKNKQVGFSKMSLAVVFFSFLSITMINILGAHFQVF